MIKATIQALLAMTATVPVAAQTWSDGHVYRCTSRQSFEFGDAANPAGTFQSRPTGRVFTYDEGSGRLHWVGTDITWEFETLQTGDDRRAMKAVRTFTGSAATVLEALHIATWEVPEVGVMRQGVYPFLYDSDGTVHGGTCIRE